MWPSMKSRIKRSVKESETTPAPTIRGSIKGPSYQATQLSHICRVSWSILCRLPGCQFSLCVPYEPRLIDSVNFFHCALYLSDSYNPSLFSSEGTPKFCLMLSYGSTSVLNSCWINHHFLRHILFFQGINTSNWPHLFYGFLHLRKHGSTKEYKECIKPWKQWYSLLAIVRNLRT